MLPQSGEEGGQRERGWGTRSDCWGRGQARQEWKGKSENEEWRRKGQKERRWRRRMLGGDSERMMMKGNSAILACSCPNKATLSLKPTIISPNTDWLTERNDYFSEGAEERRGEWWETWPPGNERHALYFHIHASSALYSCKQAGTLTEIDARTDARMHKWNLKMFPGTPPLYLPFFYLLLEELYCANCIN